MKYEAEACYVRVAYDHDFDWGIEVWIKCQNQSNLIVASFWRQWKHEIANILVTKSSMCLEFGM